MAPLVNGHQPGAPCRCSRGTALQLRAPRPRLQHKRSKDGAGRFLVNTCATWVWRVDPSRKARGDKLHCDCHSLDGSLVAEQMDLAAADVDEACPCRGSRAVNGRSAVAVVCRDRARDYRDEVRFRMRMPSS